MPTINYLTRIEFDFGAIAGLAAEIERMGLKRPLLVTDRGIAEAGILQRALAAAAPSRPVVYDGTTENPTEQSLLECLEIWNDQGCDGVIALGGGSPIDLAKAVALLTSHGGTLADYNVKTGGSAGIGKVSPQIAIPTAAGTGAEVPAITSRTATSCRSAERSRISSTAPTRISSPTMPTSRRAPFPSSCSASTTSRIVRSTSSVVSA